MYVVPAGTIPLVTFAGEAVNVSALQIVDVITAIDGFGFTVTVRVNGVPVHDPELGVTVYKAVWGEFVVLVSVPLIEVMPLPGTPPVKPEPDGALQE